METDAGTSSTGGGGKKWNPITKWKTLEEGTQGVQSATQSRKSTSNAKAAPATCGESTA